MHRHTHAQTKVILVAGRLVGEKRGIKRPLLYAHTHTLNPGLLLFSVIPISPNGKWCMYIEMSPDFKVTADKKKKCM